MPWKGYDKLEKKLKGKGAKSPCALAATMGRRKYSKAKFQEAKKKGKA